MYYIREYRPSDCRELAELFYNTVHTVNAGDYSPEQLAVWATGNIDLAAWHLSLQKHYCVVAAAGDMLVGFGDIDKTGYLDRLYVHRDYQGRGVATAICNRLEGWVKGLKRDAAIITHASITAKPFFVRRGYRVLRAQEVERGGIFLTNFVMEKPVAQIKSYPM